MVDDVFTGAAYELVEVLVGPALHHGRNVSIAIVVVGAEPVREAFYGRLVTPGLFGLA